MDNMLGLGIILSLQDKASSGLEAIRKKMTALRDVSQEMMKRFDEGAKQMIAGFALMTTGTKTLGLLDKMFGVSVNTAADFEQAMARVGAVSGATGADFEKLTKQARDLGRDTQYSATQVASSQELLARANFQTNEIIAALPDLLYMAGAEGMDMARATDIAASTLRGFGLEAAEMSRVANVLAQTSRMTNTSIDTLGESFKYVASDARMLKVPIEEVAAIVGVMGDAGVKASQAGTYLRGAFNKLVSPTKETSDALKSLGISVTDRQGELKSFDTLMQELSDKMKGMTGFQKKALFGQLFDARSATGMLAVLGGFESGKLRSSLDTLRNIGSVAKEMYDRMSATAQGAMKRLESATEGLRIAICNHLLPVYTKAIDLMAQFKSWLTQLVEEHPIISKAVIGLTAALISLAGTALILFGALVSVAGMVNMWPLMQKMAVFALTSIRSRVRDAITSFSGFGSSFAKMRVPIVGLIALAGALYYAWRKNLWGIRDMVEAVTQGFKLAWSASTDGIAEIDEALAKKLEAAGIYDYAVMMGRVFFRVRQFWNGLVEGFKEGVNFLMGIFDWLKGIFSPVIESGQELLKFLGILKPVAESHANTWKAWGQLLGRLAPAIIAVVTAFKGIRIVKGIFGDLGKAIVGMFNIITAHPIGALIVALIALGIYLYTHWEEVSAFFAKIWNKIAGYGKAAVDWIKRKWQALSDWWNSWTLTDIFAPVLDWASNVKTSVLRKWEEFSAWWDSWSLGDIFAPIYDFAVDIIAKIKQPFIDFANWLSGLFTNPFASWKAPQISTEQAKAEVAATKAKFGTLNHSPSYMQPPPSPAQKAEGGIINSPLLSWVGEAGREAIIPLENPTRGTALWFEAGRELGLLPVNLRPNAITNVRTENTVTSLVNNGGSLMNNVQHKFTSITPHATGGIFSQPHMGLVAEAGREAIIPLEKQSRGTELWIEAGRELGLISESNPTLSTYPSVNMPEVSLLNGKRIGNTKSGFSQGYDVISSIVNSLKFQPDISASQSDNRSYATIRSLVSRSARAGDVIPSIMSYVNPQTSFVYGTVPLIVNASSSRTERIAVNNQLNNSKPIERNVAQLREISAITQARDMVMRVAENSVMREVLNRAIPQIATSPIAQTLTNSITSDKIIDTSSLQKAIIERSSNETHSRFTNESSALPEIISNFMPIVPHAVGGIFSTPHIGLVAEAGREAVIPLEDKSRGIPLLMAAANEMIGENIILDQPYSLPTLVQQSQNQAIMSGQALAQTVAQPTASQPASNSKVTVNVDVKPADVYIDGEKIGRISFRWSERQSIRSGMGS